MPATADFTASPDAFKRRCVDLLEVALQPIYELSGGALHAVEALTRGADKLGFPNPHALFDEAERLGVLADVELSQIQKAIEKVSILEGDSRINLFVNLDTRILMQASDIIDRVEATLSLRGRPKRSFILELSERHDKTYTGELSGRIRALRESGFQLGLDDFGAGVSDLRALQVFDVDYLKLDRFLVDGIADDHRTALLVGRIIELAHMLGQRVVCEGVERDSDLHTCRELGCDLAQGYLLGMPEIRPSDIPPRYQSLREHARRRSDGGVDASVRSALVAREPAFYDAPLIEIANRFQDVDAPAFCAIVGLNHEPMGVLLEKDLRPFIYSPYGLDLLKNSNSGITLATLIRRYPLASVETDPDRMIDLIAGTDALGVVITNGVRYLGVLPAAALMKISNDKRIALAQDSNPLTRLPGNRALSLRLDEALADRIHSHVICYFDFDNFKPFNDNYGFRTGDRAIQLFSDILKKSLSQKGADIYHIGGDDFCVLFTEKDIDEIIICVHNILDQFSVQAQSFYEAEHRMAGGIFAHDRGGRRQFFPLLRCSAAILEITAEKSGLNQEVFAGHIARLKSAAKSSDTGVATLKLDNLATIECGVA